MGFKWKRRRRDRSKREAGCSLIKSKCNKCSQGSDPGSEMTSGSPQAWCVRKGRSLTARGHQGILTPCQEEKRKTIIIHNRHHDPWSLYSTILTQLVTVSRTIKPYPIHQSSLHWSHRLIEDLATIGPNMLMSSTSQVSTAVYIPYWRPGSRSRICSSANQC